MTDAEGTEISVPVDPQRIVTLSEPTLDGVLALGLTPIGTVSGRGQSGVPGYLSAEASQLPILGGIAEPNFEAIGQAKPDLIVVDGTSVNNNPPVIEALRAIAPTAFVGYAGGDWRDTFTTLADVLNQQEKGEQVLAAYDARVAEVKKGLTPYADDTFSIVRWQGSSAALILNELPPGRALLDLGLQRPKNQDRNGRGHSEPVSRENLTEIDADWMFFGTLGGASVDNPDAEGGTDSDAAKKALAEAEEAPGFTSLKAFRDDHITGAATGALVQIIVVGAAPTQVGVGAVLGGLVSAVVVYGLSYQRGSSSHRLVLVGIGVAATLQAANSIMIVRSSLGAAQNAVQWLAGSLNQTAWSTVLLVGGPAMIMVAVAVGLQRRLTTLALGDDLAGGLGVGVERSRLILVGVGVALVATATAIAGPVAFVALAAPQLGARLLGRGVISLPVAALMGSVVVLVSDLIAQRLFAPTQLPVGVVTGSVGGAYLIWLLHRQWRRSLG